MIRRRSRKGADIMADIARLGFAVDTDDLTIAEQKLRKLAPAAKAAEDAAKKTTSAFTGLGAAAGTAQRGTNVLINTTNAASSGTANFSKSALMAGASVRALGTATAGSDAMLSKFANTSKLTADRLNMVSVATDRATLSAGQLQANSSNLIAQFQDIGVTASMGMSPLLIGFQQGAQIALVMQQAIGGQGLLGGLKSLGAAFLAVLGPVTFLSIALTAGLAALIQYIDWATIGKSALYFLADSMETVMLAAAALGAVLLVAFAPQIIGSIVLMTRAIGVALYGAIVKATGAMIAFAVANPFGAIALAIGVALVALFAFRDKVNEIFGVDVIGKVGEAADFIVGSMVGAFKTIQATWSKLPGAIGGYVAATANRVITGVEWMVNKTIDALNYLNQKTNVFSALTGGLWTGDIGRIEFGRFDESGLANLQEIGNIASDNIGREVGKKYVTGFLSTAVDGIKGFAADAAEWLRGIADSLGVESEDDKKDRGSSSKSSKNDPWMDFVVNTKQQLDTLKMQGQAIGLVGEEAEKAAARIDLMNAARQAMGRPLIDKEKKFVDEFANLIGGQRQSNINNQAFFDQKTVLQESIATLEEQTAVLGMNEIATARAMMAQQLLNDEHYRGIKLSDDQRQQLINLAGEEANLNKVLRERMEILDLQRDTFKGFFNDLRSSLENGKSVWKSFADSIMNALQRVADKLFDLWLNDVFQSLVNPNGGGGGFFGSILSSIGSLIGSNTNSGTNPKIGVKNANGNAFGSSIINQPTMFGYGSNQVGQLGEAGPEAILPLRRGADGSLGVQMHASAASQASKARVDLYLYPQEGEMFTAKVAAIADDRAVNIVEAGISQYNDTLPDRMNEISNDPRVR